MNNAENKDCEIIVPIDDKELEEKYRNRYNYKFLTRKFIEFRYKEAVLQQYENDSKKI